MHFSAIILLLAVFRQAALASVAPKALQGRTFGESRIQSSLHLNTTVDFWSLIRILVNHTISGRQGRQRGWSGCDLNYLLDYYRLPRWPFYYLDHSRDDHYHSPRRS
jgi:hypothetical protein